MTQPSAAACRIMAMRAAYDSVDEITAVVQAYRDGDGLASALADLNRRWPELSVVPWRRDEETPGE
jgi:hypothetical protein